MLRSSVREEGQKTPQKTEGWIITDKTKGALFQAKPDNLARESHGMKEDEKVCGRRCS